MHVEELLSEQNFAPDEFSTEDGREQHQTGISPLGEKGDGKWDFVDRKSAAQHTLKFNINGPVP